MELFPFQELADMGIMTECLSKRSFPRLIKPYRELTKEKPI